MIGMMRAGLVCWSVVCAWGARADDMWVKAEPVRPAHEIRLFNGRDLSGWTQVVTVETGTCPASVWSVTNGVIRCSGRPFGYLATQQRYADYRLRVEYRWAGVSEQMNSGIFVHKTGADDFFLPKAIETQLKKGSAGDFVLLSKATLNGLDNPKNLAVPKREASSEKPDGEWNVVEITVRGDRIESSVNGVLQNVGTHAYTDAGQICLQSEGGPIEFREITLEPLP